jgi:hypothetical protein
MRQAWMAMNRRFEAGALLVAAVALGACSDDPRIPDGERYSEDVVVIDDMEDGTQYILSDDGRVGLWYTYNDASPSGTQEPSQGFPMYRTRKPDGSPDPSSQVPPRECGAGDPPIFPGEENCAFVARTWGTGQRGWGAGMGVDLNGEGGVKNPFDASEYGGIGFFATAGVMALRSNQLRVNIQEVRTTPESYLAADRRDITRCNSYNPDGTETGRCNDHYGATVSVQSGSWQWIQIPFHCMAAGGWGYPSFPGSVPPDQNVLRRDVIAGIQFQVGGADPEDDGTASLPVMDFDFSIDNLSFLKNVNDQTPCTL